MPLSAKLVVVGGDVKTAEIRLRLPSTIGRGRSTTIMLPHPLVSRQHCELYEVDGQLMVRDLGSLNGTFVNNQRITESPIAPDELLTIGAVTFRAVYEAAVASSIQSMPPSSASSSDTNIANNDSLTSTTPAEDIVDVEMEELEIQETSSISQPLGGAKLRDNSPGSTEFEVSDVEEVESLDNDSIEEVSGETSLKADETDRVRSPQKGITSPTADNGEPSDEEDDLQDFLKSLGG